MWEKILLVTGRVREDRRPDLPELRLDFYPILGSASTRVLVPMSVCLHHEMRKLTDDFFL